MYRMTKAQRRDLVYIQDWIRGERELEPSFVKDKYIPSYDPLPMGEFYTPEAMVNEIMAMLFYPQESRILDPCAGIGAMSRQFLEAHPDWGYEVHAYELSGAAYQILKRLYPDSKGDCADVFDRLHEIEGTFEYVVMNPPFGAVAGQESAARVCVSGATTSQHRFLELAVRAVAPGGYIIVIAPSDYINRIPEKAQKWFGDRMNVEHHHILNGRFRFAGIKVEGYIIHRLNDPHPVGQINLFELTEMAPKLGDE